MSSGGTSNNGLGGYSVKLGYSRLALRNYDRGAALLLHRTIYNGNYKFTLKVTLLSEASLESLESLSPVNITGVHKDPTATCAVGRRVADVLWEVLNICTYGWNRDPNDKNSTEYYRASLPPPDELDRFSESCCFPVRPGTVSNDLWNQLGEVTRRYETARWGHGTAAAGRSGMIEMIERQFARMSVDLTTLAGKLMSSPETLLAEWLFPGSSSEVEVCVQYASNGNRTSFICATATHTFDLLFDTS